jgi:hypothetical protein
MNDVSTEAENKQEYLLDFICYLCCNIMLLVNIQHVYYRMYQTHTVEMFTPE